jgi:hypothetical protein
VFILGVCNPGKCSPKYLDRKKQFKLYGTGRNQSIQTKSITIKPEIIWNFNISEDGKSYQQNYAILFPKYSSAIDEE